MDSTHECPRTGCTRRIPATHLACPSHWRAVPWPLRRAVWNAWDGGRGAGTPQHRAAIAAAIGSIKEGN